MLAETVATASQRGHESDVVRLNHASDVPTQPGRSSSAPRPEGDRVWAGRSSPDRAKQRSKTDSQLADGRKQTTGRWVRAWGWPTPLSWTRNRQEETEAAQAAQAAALRLSLCRGWRPQKQIRKQSEGESF